MYESPRITDVAGAVELTLGQGIAGNDDHGVFIGRYGQEIPVSYGVS